MSTDNLDPSKADPSDYGDAGYNKTVADRLRFLAEAPVPETWDKIVARTNDTETSTGSQTETRWGKPLAIAAAIALIAGGAVVAVLNQGGNQRINTQVQTTSEEGVDTSHPVSSIPDADDNSESSDADDTIANESDADRQAVFPVEVDIGLDRRARSTIPSDTFAISYEAGTVITDPDGQVLGHYPGELPNYVPSRGDLVIPTVGGVPDECELDAMLGGGQLRLLCESDTAPWVEIVDADGNRRPIASFPPRPEHLPPEARVHGFIQSTFPNPLSERGGPLLLQWIAECETRMAMMVDNAVWSAESPNGGSIRHMDGATYWQGPWPDGESVALGWSTDGTAGYVWRFNSGCSTALDVPGVYAYGLDGSSRLLFPTVAGVSDVYYIPSSTGVGSYDGGEVRPSSTELMLVGKSEQWIQWAGPLDDPLASGLDPGIDHGLISEFIAEQLGFDRAAVELVVSQSEPRSWIVAVGEISIRLRPNVWFDGQSPSSDELASWTVEHAETFRGDNAEELSAAVHNRLGAWIAVFVVPTFGDAIDGRYQLGDQLLEPNITDLFVGGVELRFDLDDEPTVPASLTITWVDDKGDLVGFERRVIAPGTMAAG